MNRLLALAAPTLGVLTSVAAAPENLALGRPCSFSWTPNYPLCRDEGDAVQLTDGVYATPGAGFLWTQKAAVGWTQGDGRSSVNPPVVTVDLGSDVPICGFSWSTASGAGGVQFPKAIEIYVSVDGASWHFVGDLLARALTKRIMPPPCVYNPYRAWTDDMFCHGRYVKFVTVQDGYCFVDELEIYRGEDGLLLKPLPGASVADPVRFHETLKLRSKLVEDSRAVGAGEELLHRIDAVSFDDLPKGFKTILPLNDVHRSIYAANVDRLHAAGYEKPILWHNCRWENLDPVTVPSAVLPVPEIALMRGEVRSETVNVLNPTREELSCRFSVKGYGAETPVECREVVFTDTRLHRTVSGALVGGKSAEISFAIPAGTSRQVWMTVVRPTGVAGVRRGRIVARLSNGVTLESPLNVRVAGLDLPRPALHCGGWDYLDMLRYKTTCRQETFDFHRAMGVDIVWAGKVRPEGDPLDFTALDAWVESCPGMRVYAVFLAVADTFRGAKAGTPEFDGKVRAYFSAWAEHARQQGFGTGAKRLLVLLVDEPQAVAQAQTIIRWARPIRDAAKGVIEIFEDPLFTEPEKIPAEFWDVCDIVCPSYAKVRTPSGAAFYHALADAGKEIWLYEAHGPSRTFDPVSYYRMQAWTAFSFASGQSGSQFWAFGCGGGIGNSWTAYEQRGTEYSPYFVSPSGPTPAKQSEAVRESLEDYEYLRMYADRFGRAAAMKIVNGVLERIPFGDPDWDAPGRDHAFLDKVRVRMLDRLQAGRVSVGHNEAADFQKR